MLFEASTVFTSTPFGSAFIVPAARLYSLGSTLGAFASSAATPTPGNTSSMLRPAVLSVKKSAKNDLMIAAVSSAFV